jgi:ribosomal protein L32
LPSCKTAQQTMTNNSKCPKAGNIQDKHDVCAGIGTTIERHTTRGALVLTGMDQPERK